MATRGPRPKPTRLKELAGNPGKRPLNRGEPKPKAGVPTPPSHLDGTARREWKRISQQLAACRLLTAVDRTALALYCTAYSRWAEAEKQVREVGTVVRTKNGYPVLSPYLIVANKAMEQLTRLLAELGLSPAARTRISIAGPSSENDSAEQEFFGPRAVS